MAKLEVVKTDGSDYSSKITASDKTKIQYGNKKDGTNVDILFENGQPIVNSAKNNTTFMNSGVFDALMNLVGDDNVLDESDLAKAKPLFGRQLDDSKLDSEGKISVTLSNGEYLTVDIYTKAEQKFDKELKENTKSTAEKAMESFGNFLRDKIWEPFARQIDRFTYRL